MTDPTKSSTDQRERLNEVLEWLLPSAIFVLTFVAFIPTLQNDFTNFDDPANLIENTNYRGLGPAYLRWMFTTFHGTLYRPLTWVTLGLDYHLWGMDATGYHLTSIIFHCANAVMAYFVFLRLLRLAFAPQITKAALSVSAAFATLVFSLHPLRAEAVAWASARNDVVAPLFFLLTLYFYLAAAEATSSSARKGWLTLSVGAYGLSLLAKSIGMTLPVVLILLDIYPLRRLDLAFDKRWMPQALLLVREKIPFVGLALVFAVVAFIAKQDAIYDRWRYGLGIRIADSVYGLAFYMWKTVLPFNLSPLYPRSVERHPWDWPFLVSGAVVLLISVGVWIFRKRWPAGLIAWLYYAVSLLPVLGFIQYGPQFVADRYSYLACLSWAALAGGAILYSWQLWSRGDLAPLATIAGVSTVVALLGILGFLNWKQVQAWHDSERLWSHAVAVNPSAAVHQNLGALLIEQGRTEEGTGHYRQAVELAPNDPDIKFSLATILYTQNNLDEALNYFRRVVELEHGPTRYTVHFYIGNIMAKKGNFEEALKRYQNAIRANPGYAEAYRNMGHVYYLRQEFAQAVSAYREAIKINPSLADTQFSLALALFKQKDFAAAKELFQQLLANEPNSMLCHYYLAHILISQGELETAIDHLKRALRIDPQYADGHLLLSQALAARGKTNDAAFHRQEAERLAAVAASRKPASGSATRLVLPTMVK